MEELIPLISAMVQPIALRFSLRISNNSSCLGFRSDATITGKIFAEPKYVYLRCLGRGFNSNLGASSIDGLGDGLTISMIGSVGGSSLASPIVYKNFIDVFRFIDWSETRF